MKSTPSTSRIYLRSTYDHRFRRALFRAINDTVENYQELTDFIRSDFVPVLEASKKSFFDNDDKNLNRTIAPAKNQAETKMLGRFLNNKGDLKNVSMLQRIHAYLHLKDPPRAARLDPDRATDTIGEIFGIFLRDPHLYQSEYSLALDGQRILGLYHYEARDIAGLSSGETRYLAFLPGASADYLLCVDFYIRENEIIRANDHLRLQYGFCVPGHEFSPLILRTHRHHERIAGVLYTPNALTDFQSDLLSDLTMAVFTTDKAQFGHQSENEMHTAMRVINGPRIQVILKRVEKRNLISELERKIAQFRREYL